MKRQRGGRKAVGKARTALVRRVAEPEEGKGQAAHSAKSPLRFYLVEASCLHVGVCNTPAKIASFTGTSSEDSSCLKAGNRIKDDGV